MTGIPDAVRISRRRLLPILLVVFALLVSLLAAEGLVRLFFPHSRDHVVPAGLFAIDDDLGWKLAPGKRGTHKTRYFETTYSINASGFRDRPRGRSKADGIHRVLLYGDSQVFGWGLQSRQRFSDSIEAGNAQFEIWNLAVPGYGLDQEVLSYELTGAQLNADEVVFFISKHTLRRMKFDYIYRKHKPKFVIDGHGGLRLVPIPKGANAGTSVIYKVLTRFHLPYFLDQRVASLRRSAIPSVDESDPKIAAAGVALGEPGRRLLARVRTVARERNHRMTILVDSSEIPAGLAAFCDQTATGLLLIDVPTSDPELVFGKHDQHWNPRAHALITASLLSQLATRAQAPLENE